MIEGVELGAQLKYIAYHIETADKPDLKHCVAYCEDCGGLALEVTSEVLGKTIKQG